MQTKVFNEQASMFIRNVAKQCVRIVQARYRKTVRASQTAISGIRLPVPSEFDWDMRNRLYEERYEGYEVFLVRTNLLPGDRVLELGTGLGLVATACAQIVGSASVVTVEANPEMIRHIEETFRLNGVRPTLISAAVGAETGQAELFINESFMASSCCSGAGEGRAVTVPMVGLPDLLNKHQPTFMVVDIEGGELELTHCVLPETVRCVLVELHERVIGRAGVDEVRQWLRDGGFMADRSTAGQTREIWER